MAIISLRWANLRNPNKQPSLQDATGAAPILPTPTFTSATASSYTVAITGYDAQFTYTVSASVGSAVRTGGNVTVSGLSGNQSSTLTITAANTARELSFSASQAFLSLPDTPILSRSGGTTTTVTVVIGNYDAGLTYTIGASVGSATRSENTITVTGLTEGQATTITATASNVSGNSAQGSLATGAVPNTPTVSFGSATSSTLTFNITNFNAAYTYNLSPTAGSASRSGSSITVSGLSAGQSVTMNVTATANGVTSATGSASGSTIQVATGGSISPDGSYVRHTFTGSGTFSLNVPKSVEVVVVGGGGAGNGNFYSSTTYVGQCGGGGGGGVISTTLSLSAGSYPVVVGGGGTGSSSPAIFGGSNGSNSSFSTQTAIGGGKGGSGAIWGPYNAGPDTIRAANPGGSGGGGGSLLTGGSGTPGQGNPGGAGSPGQNMGGGGGGAGAAGGIGTRSMSRAFLNSQVAGPGGSGVSTWAGTFGGGGGGGSAGPITSTSSPTAVQPAPGGAGGGGAGGYVQSPNNPGIFTAQSGVANTGGGSGGNHNYVNNPGASRSGGSGIVVIRYIP